MSEETTPVVASSADLADLPAEAREALGEALRPRTLRAGEVLFDAGEPADGMVVIDRGRLGVTDEDGAVIATMGRGDVVGEMGALTGQPRTSTVIALRDTSILGVDQAAFDHVFDSNPVVGRALSRLVVNRLLGSGADEPSRSIPRTIAIVEVGGGAEPKELLSALEAIAGSMAVVAEDLALERTDAEILTALENLESDNDLVVLLAGSTDDPDDWFDRCLRQADSILVIVAEPHRPAPVSLDGVADRLGEIHSIVELVVMNPAGAELGHDATRWIERLRPDRLHQVRRGDRATADRCARLVLGQGIGLVFSGGAAKGLAHLGAWRAISELDIDVDTVAGVSLGSLLGAGVALDYSPRQLHDEVRDGLVNERNGLVDLTFPWMAILRGQGISERLQGVLRGRRFEQTWRSFMCTSCDLTTGGVVEHRSGLLWQAIRASVSIPGVLPPVRMGDQLLVDGAVRNNLPITNIRAGHPTPLRVIAVDVGKDGYLAAGETPDVGHVSGWRLMVRRVNPRRTDPGVPSMPQVLMRVMELAGEQEGDDDADTYIRPDLRSLGLGDFEQIDGFEQAGYDATIAALS